ncbi:carboxypeptidase-like regulatory domain-containing protein [Lutimonas saemankumensis]|uniref:carboxypeptidase-like regulatory domain-containing protein n=1 Tax=Lutimonas saemankumensis TaxID=483016 RepID=UPI001CD33DE6|nr:carboxypeptidase-like regulatory domain-containing protein [Lutimonas saemankumensis]MCA0933130.1 carboxypeptidase-like regulatory domain-containing protein [Lutimonas saemankumensis]
MQLRLLFAFLLLVSLGGLNLHAQDNSFVTGKIINGEDNLPLPFASIRLKNHQIGTISNDDGEFDFYIPKSKRNDTLSISFIGFNSYEVPLQNIDRALEIILTPSSNVLDEIILTEKDPLDYIKKALERLSENYPQEPYQSLAYYREKFIENGAVINKEEGVFKTYYPKVADSSKNQHQLLLYKPEENPQQFQFMREWFEAKQEKRRKKAIKRGEEFDEEEYDSDMDMDLGGPESVIDLDINNERDNYLNPKYFKKYEYSFGDETSLNGERLVTINFKAKRTIDHIKDSGKILINTEDFAIVSIERKGKFSIPFIVKPILFVIGLKIQNPTFSTVISYQKYKEKWYPQLFRWDANVKLTKKHTFDPNENSDINIGQVFLINQVDSIATPVSEEHLFNEQEDMAGQVFNDMDLKWEGLNIIKD